MSMLRALLPDRLLLRLALRNLLRHRGRSLMTGAGIAFGVVAMMLAGGFVRDSIRGLGEALIHSQYGHLQIAREGYFEVGTRAPERYLWETEALAARLARQPEVAQTLARVRLTGLLNNGRSDLSILAEGIQPDRENRLNHAMRLTAGRALTDADANGILVGDGVARALGLKPGDPVTLVANTTGGALNSAEFEVVGSFQTYFKEYDAHAVRIPLDVAQSLLAAPGAHTLVVELHATEQTEAVAQALALPAGLTAHPWQTLNSFFRNVEVFYQQQFGALQLIVLAMVLLSVANTVNMSVHERIGEFGTLQAVGDRRFDVIRLIVSESAMLGALAASTGVLLGLAAATAINQVGIPMPPPPNADIGYTARIQLDAALCLQAGAIGFVATLAASLWPAWRASRVPIVDALRRLS